MKELLKELGFEHLPMLSAFVKAIKTDNIFGFAMSETKDFQLDYAKKMAKELDTINEYTDFITQPPTKGMFIPCSEDGEVLSEPESYNDYLKGKALELWHPNVKQVCQQYQQAKDRVLFKGRGVNDLWTLNSAEWVCKHGTIEQAINNGVKLELK
jgi:hypothetical protein